MCLFCDKPVKGDKYGDKPHRFKASMIKAPYKEIGCCLVSCICPPCTQFVLRKEVLDGDMTKYSCCQVCMVLLRDGFVHRPRRPN